MVRILVRAFGHLGLNSTHTISDEFEGYANLSRIWYRPFLLTVSKALVRSTKVTWRSPCTSLCWRTKPFQWNSITLATLFASFHLLYDRLHHSGGYVQFVFQPLVAIRYCRTRLSSPESISSDQYPELPVCEIGSTASTESYYLLFHPLPIATGPYKLGCIFRAVAFLG
ncbi:hypothetical protein LOAG_09504 [Loa loa]|uniref:Uncharacterized protein n=1 Tax=Loa loa TaxID=7209 RepID=A0A1S0TT05_LOALO|nr:hypothetical protein LOAG_09504 [Loa loa]EFO18990.1 hypothetical protein LOAG_09504 [Loa loa]